MLEDVKNAFPYSYYEKYIFLDLLISKSFAQFIMKKEPTTATTTTNRPFSLFFEVVFVVTHRGVSFAHSSLRNADTKLP